MGRSRQWWIPVLVLALLAAWWWRDRSVAGAGVAPASRDAEPSQVESYTRPSPPPAQTPALPGGYVGPDPSSLSPAERDALRDAEVERSAAAAAPAT